LRYDSAAQTLTGTAPGIRQTGQVTFTAVNDSGEVFTHEIALNIVGAQVTVVSDIELSAQSTEINRGLDFNVADAFSSVGKSLNYVVYVKDESGRYETLAQSDVSRWLSFDKGQFSAKPGATDATFDALQLKVVASESPDPMGDYGQGEGTFTLMVDGPVVSLIPPAESVTGKPFSMNLSQYFKGLDPKTTYYSVNLVDENAPAPVSGPALFATKVASTPESNLPSWLTLDSRTGVLTGTPPLSAVGHYKFDIRGDDGETELETQVEANVAEESTKEQHWFEYDAENRVTLDGGTLGDGKISIASQGQRIFYNNAGQQDLIIRATGNIAQKFEYNLQGQLTNVDGYINKDTVNMSDWSHGSFAANNWGKVTVNDYTLTGQLAQTTEYFQPGSTREGTWYVREGGGIPFAPLGPEGDGDLVIYDRDVELTNTVSKVKTFIYNNDGQTKEVKEFGWSGAFLAGKINSKAQSTYWDYATGELKPGTIEMPSLNFGVERFDLTNNSDFHLSTIANTYDDAGRQSAMSYSKLQAKDVAPTDENAPPVSFVHSFGYEFEGRESYLEKKVNGAGTSHFKPATTTSFYDENGNRTAVESKNTESADIDVRYFDYTAQGQMIRKTVGTQSQSIATRAEWVNISNDWPDGEPEPDGGIPEVRHRSANDVGFKGVDDGKGVSHYVFGSGNYLGEFKEDGTIRVKQQHFSAFDQNSSSDTSKYTAQTGETLRSIATVFYGNADYWYVIADANGLAEGADSPLDAGTTLVNMKICVLCSYYIASRIVNLVIWVVLVKPRNLKLTDCYHNYEE
jgi:hypothetical protein